MRRNDMDTALRRVRDNRHADLLFNIVSNRSQQNSTIITTNRPFAEWGEAFPNAACLVALVDRLARNTEILAINGDSYRRKEAEERQKQRRAERRGLLFTHLSLARPCPHRAGLILPGSGRLRRESCLCAARIALKFLIDEY